MHRKCGRIRTNLNMRSAGAQLGPMKNLPEKGTKGVLYQKIQLRMMIISLGQYSSSPVTAWKTWLIDYSSYRNLYLFCNKNSRRIHQDREYIIQLHAECKKFSYEKIFLYSAWSWMIYYSSRIFDSYCCRFGTKGKNSAYFWIWTEFRFFVIFLLLPYFLPNANLGLEQRIRNKLCLTQ